MLPNLKVTYRRMSELRTFENNARQHSRKQLDKLKTSIETFGWTNPIIVDETGMVLCGHGRLAAAVELGFEAVPTIEIGDMTEAQKRAYVIADNALAEKAHWSKAMKSGTRSRVSAIFGKSGFTASRSAMRAIRSSTNDCSRGSARN